ncbi:hypothetical protein [Haloferula sp. BvORR071]|uniref:hypothetical protein n=1 Tax=Haloferula sp. BvORR071 TaxID=1396141 RepID=UPI00054F9951|nr:hypothetical protein [Haloferula sp. BvORR071]
MKALPAIAVLGGLQFLASPTALAAGQIVYAFSPGDLAQWTQVTIPGGNSLDRRFYATSSNFGNRITWGDPNGNIGGLVVTSADNIDSRDGAHNTAVLRSPTFTLNGTNPAADLGTLAPTEISFKLLAGMGSTTGPASFSSLPAVSVNNVNNVAWVGVALHRVTDDAYLKWGRRTSTAQGNAWETVTWNAAALSAAVASDPPGTLYTLDLIDAAHGSWGWLAMDSLTMIDANTLVNVSVKPLDTVGAESGADQNLSVRFSRTGNVTPALAVNFTLQGTAAESADFDALPNYVGPDYVVNFPAGVSSVDVPLHIIPNSDPQLDRFVRFKILESNNYSIAGATADLYIQDLPAPGCMIAVSGPLSTGNYLPIPNPFTEGAAGSLFFYGEATYSAGYLTLGIRGVPQDNSVNGGVDIGRNNASAGAAIFDYLDNKGGASATARAPGSPEIGIQPGIRCTLIGEIEMHADKTGTLRGWVWDGTNGTLDYSAPNIVTTFSSGFTGLGEQIYLRLDAVGNPGNTWTNARAAWVEGSDPVAREAAFHALDPARPFLYVDSPAGAGEYGPNQQLVFNVFRSGAPDGALEVPLQFSGTASAADFTAAFPTSASFASGQSSVQFGLPIASDSIYEGNESLGVDLQNTTQWLLPLTASPAGTVNDRPFQGWMATYLPGNTGGAEDDADHDFSPNILEYFSGSLPSDPLSRTFVQLAPGQNTTLRFQRDPRASDVVKRVLWSTDLTTWHESGESEGALNVTITETVAGVSESGIETVDSAASFTGGTPQRIFLRLSVDLSPANTVSLVK